MNRMLKKCLARLHRDNRGTVAITFILSLPILLFVVGIFMQYALLVNARMGVNRAAMAAARSAMTSMPTDPDVDYMQGDANVKRTAYMALEPLSPRANTGSTQESQDVVTALQNVGISVPDTYATRYTYAQEATTIEWVRVDDANQPIDEATWQPLDFAGHVGQRIKLTVHYKFYLTVPGVRSLPSFGVVDTVAGINGRFLDISSSYIVQLTHGREAGTNNAP